jgi:leader peptidase (prepilin peptidase) / N-methyltransferase
VIGAVVLAWLAALSVYDLRERRLPNWLTLPGAAVVLIGALAMGRGMPALLGAVSLFGVYLAVHLAAPTAMGAGDVKLAIGLGALTAAFGAEVWMLAAFAAPLFTGAWAVVVVLRRRGRTVPHGPAMCAAAVLAIWVQIAALSGPDRARIGADWPTCENGTRVAMDYCR